MTRTDEINAISIHALREEGDQGGGRARRGRKDFYPRPPRGGRQPDREKREGKMLFLSTPSARRATHEPEELPGGFFISIHALREEGDPAGRSAFISQNNFYPRPPRGGRPGHTITRSSMIYFYPRPPRGGRPKMIVNIYTIKDISIHALREEGDTSSTKKAKRQPYFYPRPPRGGRQ